LPPADLLKKRKEEDASQQKEEDIFNGKLVGPLSVSQEDYKEDRGCEQKKYCTSRFKKTIFSSQ
jgi:hypothetical protein